MSHRWDPITPPISGLVPPVRVDPTGRDGPTRAQARGPGWVLTSPGLYLPASVDRSSVEQRIVEARARGGVVTGWASLRLQGAAFFDGLARDGRTRLPVPLAANGSRLRARDGIAVVEDRIPPDEIVIVHGIRCAKVHRALYDEMQRIGEIREMAIAVGATCAAQLTSVRRMRLYAATRRWYRDVRVVKAAIELSVERCRSPREDRFRQVWELDAQWGRPLINRTILDLDGRFVATPDLFDPERCVIGEYAGAGHRDIDQHESDVERLADVRRVGLECVEVVSRTLRHPRRVVVRMEEAARRIQPGPRLWTIAPLTTPSLDEILDRRDAC
jgi:hypothetical protein